MGDAISYLFGGRTSRVNQRGDEFSDALRDELERKEISGRDPFKEAEAAGGVLGSQARAARQLAISSGAVPTRAAYSSEEKVALFRNWLTGGGPPKPLDVSKSFGEATKLAPSGEAAGRGQGFYGLFGIGPPLVSMKPLNQSPLRESVPSSTPALVKVRGGP